MRVEQLSVGAGSEGGRLDLFVGAALKLSRGALKALFDAGAVRIDGRIAKKGDRLEGGQAITVRLSEPELAIQPEPSSQLVVLYQDDQLVFVDKPALWPSHPLLPEETGTVANALIARFPECEQASESPREGGLCHRLDAETSGVLLAARTRDAWLAMRQAFSEQRVDKRYCALVTGPITEEGEIELPLAHRKDRVVPELGGAKSRPARSSFRVLRRSQDYALVEVRIFTGVLHQVRAHLSAIGAPIVGDALYGGRPEPLLSPQASRFFLHACSLEVPAPASGARVRVESPLPNELEALLSAHGLVPTP